MTLSEQSHYSPNRGVSIIIPVFDAAERLDRLLSSFFRINTFFPVEMIVIDHGNNDSTTQILIQHAPKCFIRLIRCRQDYTSFDCCNLGASRAIHPYLLFVDNGIVYTSDVLAGALAQLGKDSGIGAVGVRLDDFPDGLEPGREQGIQHLGIDLKWNEQRNCYQAEPIRRSSLKTFLAEPSGGGAPAVCDAVTWQFMLVRRSDFQSLGGFCKKEISGMEHIDFCVRLKGMGKKCLCIEDIGLQHHPVDSRYGETEKLNAAAMEGAPKRQPVQYAKIHKDIDIIRKSGLFDSSWYRQKYSDFNADTDPVEDYCAGGWMKERDPCPDFSTKYYLDSNPDIASASVNPFVHYIVQGKKEGRSPLPTDLDATSPPDEILDAQYVEYIGDPLIDFDPPVKAVCFYLPQYHEIPENDQWWGKGFTEWTNVRPAKPKFRGHYQPRIPGELEYYNLLDPGIQKRQIELARQYGLHGFCFYYYWFGGKRLLEKPVENYLNDPSLDFPFCLCWANENWTRRWDGLDHDVLIAQKHSPQDDIAFIEDVARYFQDRRYIKVDEKPILVVYRPSLLPSARKTASRWRKWCRRNGIGEIFLALTHSFDTINPREIGYDAAIEFPPNNQHPPEITSQISGIKDDFEGKIFDWGVFPERSQKYEKPAYPLFRGVCPSWDNTARKKNRGNILYGSSPRGYQNWLYNAILDTSVHWPASNRLVFINAWNEWAEAAYLEPDAEYGYAYLDATRMAMIRAKSHLSKNTDFNNKTLAVAIHAFYPDVLEEIVQRISLLKNTDLKLYVTSPPDRAKDVLEILGGSGLGYQHLPTENRGRDVLPFFKILKDVIKNKHDVLLKLHTKRSTHRQDGKKWRDDIYDRLLTPDASEDVLRFFSDAPEAGIVGPKNHILPMDCYWGSNEKRILELSTRLGIHKSHVFSARFVAGTMFYARTRIFMPALGLVDESSFEEEKGQIDGTMAHAFERLFSVCAIKSGLKVYDTDFTDANLSHHDNYEYVN